MLSISGQITVVLVSQNFLVTCGASAVPSKPQGQSSHHDDNRDISGWSYAWSEAVAGTPPLFALHDQPADLAKRDCSANGTNFCFGNDVNYCASCGTCCSDSASQWCCAANGVCCGNACCSSGQICSNGQCFLPVTTVTSTSTLLSTVSHVSTQLITVVDVVLETSTFTSVIDVTVSSPEATQTELTIVTVTAPAKRGLSTPLSRPVAETRDEDGYYWSALVSIILRGGSRARNNRQLDTASHLGFSRRQAGEPSPEAGVTTTVIVYVTHTTDITEWVSSTVASPSTSLVLTTVYETSSIVLDAKTTISATSTITETPYEPSTVTIVETTGQVASSSTAATADPVSSSTATSTPATTPATPPLLVSTIAGIAVGSTVFALIAAFIIFLLCRRHRRNKDSWGYRNDHFIQDRRPIPPTSQPSFLPSAPPQFARSPSHHGDQFHFHRPAPTIYSARSKTRPRHHHRSSSGFTTLVSHGTPPAEDSSSSGAGPRSMSPAEMPGSQPRQQEMMDDRRSITSDDTIPDRPVNFQYIGGQWIIS